MNAPLDAAPRGRGRWTEAWCLAAAGSAAEREGGVRAFGAWRWSRVLAPEAGEPAEWAAAIARASGSPLEQHAELGPGGEGAERARRVLVVLEGALAKGTEPVLLVLAPELPSLVVARALGLPFERASAIQVDPGRAVLLRDGPHGFTLRRTNAPAPVSDAEGA